MGSPRRRAWWAAVACASLVTVVGAVLITRSTAAPDGPAAVVLRYFTALQEGNAGLALSLGAAPTGDRRFLTAGALQEQQQLAPIGDVRVTAVRRHGGHVTVRVGYSLDFADGNRVVHAAVPLTRAGSTWRLRRVAATTRVVVSPAGRRATLAGDHLPHGRVVLFPGAVPITFDSPYLQVSASADVGFESSGVTVVRPELSRAGRLAVIARTAQQLRACLRRRSDPACPQPPGRSVPGSMSGRLVGRPDIRVALAHSPFGVIDVHGRATAAVRYSRLTFRDRAVRRSGQVRLRFHTAGYAVVPLRLRWRAS